MKKLNYEFTDSDIKTLVFCLKVIPFVDFHDVSPVQQEINNFLAISTIEKLLNRTTDISINELRIMSVALDLAYLISVDDSPYKISSEANTDFSPYIFSINKLRDQFSTFL